MTASGDFAGLTQQAATTSRISGVNTIWLLPFYPSPGKDDGYDIADYHNIHPQYGTREDFKHLRRTRRIAAACASSPSWSSTTPRINIRGSRPPAARRPARRSATTTSGAIRPDKYAGNPDHLPRYRDLQLGLDPVAKAYYWHRFFSHQPDLNFDNPHVVRAVIHIMEYWLDTGVDGLRLDAIPYLIERDGTNNENLRETHDVIKRIRKVINDRYADRMLLAEANQWPEDVRDYFGDGDECHMAYHFPLMPRMYMAIAQEDRHPDRRDHGADARHPGQLPVGDLPAQPRRAHSRNGHEPRTRLHVQDVRRRSARPSESRHPPPARAADGERSGAHQADEQPAAVHAGRADHLLRR